jgi:hypothetical protein
MIDINEIKGKSVQYVGKISLCFSKGQYYRIGFDDDVESLFTIDDDGDYHSLTADYIKEAFDVAAYIKKPSMVGKYVRYVQIDSGFMRKNDIGMIVKEHDGGDFDVRWLNPIQAHTQEVPAWWVSKHHIEVIG